MYIFMPLAVSRPSNQWRQEVKLELAVVTLLNVTPLSSPAIQQAGTQGKDRTFPDLQASPHHSSYGSWRPSLQQSIRGSLQSIRSSPAAEHNLITGPATIACSHRRSSLAAVACSHRHTSSAGDDVCSHCSPSRFV